MEPSGARGGAAAARGEAAPAAARGEAAPDATPDAAATRRCANAVVDMPPRYTHGSVILRQARVAHEGGVAHRPTGQPSC